MFSVFTCSFFCDLLHPTATTPGTVPASALAFLSLCFIFMAMLIAYPVYRQIHKSLLKKVKTPESLR